LCTAELSNMMCRVGWSSDEQVAESNQGIAAPADARRTAAAQGRCPGRSGAPRGCHAHHGQQLEPGSAARGIGGAEGRGAWPALEARPVAARRAAQGVAARCAGRRLSHRPVDAPAGRLADPAALEASIQRKPSLAHPDRAGLLLAAPQLPSAGAQRACDQTLEARALAGVKKTLPDKAESSSSSTSRD
jgi:hypothetical protein